MSDDAPVASADAPLDLDLDEIMAEDVPSHLATEPSERPQPDLSAIAADVEETVGEMAAEALRREPVPSASTDADVIDDPAARVPKGPERSSTELTFLDVASFADGAVKHPGAAAHDSHEIDALVSDEGGFVSYSEPVIAPRPEVPGRATPLDAARVPAVPDRDLQVAASLEAVAQRIRAGDLALPGIEAASEDAALAIALAALMAARH